MKQKTTRRKFTAEFKAKVALANMRCFLVFFLTLFPLRPTFTDDTNENDYDFLTFHGEHDCFQYHYSQNYHGCQIQAFDGQSQRA